MDLNYLAWSDLYVKVAPLVGDLEDLWPGESIDTEPVPVYQQAVGTHAKHDVNPLGVLRHSTDAQKEIKN